MFGMHRHRVGRLSIQRVCQLTFAVLINGYAVGFQKGKIYTGKSKALCVPVLNCYSCPGALGACPIGSLQTVLGRTARPFLRVGNAYAGRNFDWARGVRTFVSVRTGAGFAA